MVSVVSVSGAMEPRTNLGEDKNIFLHGVWVAGLKISDRLVSSIASEFSHKPSRRCTLALSRVGLDFQVLPALLNLNHPHALDQASITSDMRPGKSQHISFPFLRDFSINPHNQHCLMVVFVDSKNRFSILVFSCDNPRTLWQVTKDYQDLRNRKVIDQPSTASRVNGSAVIITSGANLNQQSKVEDTPTEQVITVNGVVPKPKPPGVKIHTHSQNGNSYTSIDVPKTEENGTQGAVIRVSDSEVQREVANSGANGSVKTFHVSTQVPYESTGSSTESLTRSVSWSHDVEDNVFETEGEPPQPTSVSATAYHNFRNIVSATVNTTVVNGHGPKPNGSLPNGNAYELRNVGTQTEPMTPQRTRYTKKVLKPTLSNQYKDKVAAVRKKSGSTATTTATTSTAPSATISIMSAEPQGELLRASSGKSTLVLEPAMPGLDAPQPVVQQPPPPIRHRLSTSRSTISRPIETVYTRRMKFQAQHVNDVDVGDKEPQGRGHFAGPKRVVVLPNNQAVVLTPGPPRDGNSIYQNFQYVQNPYVSAHPRLRTSSTSSSASRNSSRGGSLRAQREGRPGQTPTRPISYPPPPR